ncbi:MAG TPA: hypothetical protein VFV08_06790 [Puia sp.]|nr:hypothetical protein [Puia sp.]
MCPVFLERTMNKLTALFLILVVAGSTFNKAIILIDYSLNKNFIASTLCENRNKPARCCLGKCFLKKQLQKEESDKNNPGNSKEKMEVTLYCEELSDFHAAGLTLKPIAFRDFQVRQYSAPHSSVFHPPAGKLIA